MGMIILRSIITARQLDGGDETAKVRVLTRTVVFRLINLSCFCFSRATDKHCYMGFGVMPKIGMGLVVE